MRLTGQSNLECEVKRTQHGCQRCDTERQLETQLRQFHIPTSHQTPEIARAQAQSGSRNLKVAGGIDYGALDESPLEVIDARIETAGCI